MKKKTNIKNVIRQIVREEVAVAIKEVITELRQPSLSSEPTKKPSKSAAFKNNFAYKHLEVTRSIFKYNRKLTMITPEELIQQTKRKCKKLLWIN